MRMKTYIKIYEQSGKFKKGNEIISAMELMDLKNDKLDIKYERFYLRD